MSALIPHVEPELRFPVLLQEAAGGILAPHGVDNRPRKEHLLALRQGNVELFVGSDQHAPMRVPDCKEDRRT